MEVYSELAGPLCIVPIDIVDINVYTDSLVVISWLNSYNVKLDKMSKKSVFVMNRLSHISKICETFPIQFSFTAGLDNPADCVTRCFSYKQLMKTNFYTGPKFLLDNSKSCDLTVVIPDPVVNEVEVDVGLTISNQIPTFDIGNVINTDKYSSFFKLIKVMKNVLLFINRLKSKVKLKNDTKPDRIIVEDNDLYKESVKTLIKGEQSKFYSKVLDYFNESKPKLGDIPDIVSQLNIFKDDDGLLRLKSKCENLQKSRFKHRNFPILLAKDSHLTKLIILDLHEKLSHSGKYVLLKELRKDFWVPHGFSVVKKILKSCIVCRRLNERCIKLNQSPYRLERLSPIDIPFNQIYLDYIGPFTVKSNGKQEKIWLLCITCMWSRGINLKICDSLSVNDFLRAFQIHCYEYGLPQFFFFRLGKSTCCRW